MKKQSKKVEKKMEIKRLPQKINLRLARDFGYIIKQMRQECGLSQNELAQEVGFKSGTAISLYESGDREVSANVLNNICAVCGYQLEIKYPQ